LYYASVSGKLLDLACPHRGRREIEIPQSEVQRLVLSPDGQSIAVGFFSTRYPPAQGFIRIFRLRDKRVIQTIESPCAWIDALAFTPDGKQIVAGLQDTSIVIWDVHKAE
jgi:WD40 repeat protein